MRNIGVSFAVIVCVIAMQRSATADDAVGGLMLDRTWLQSGDHERTALSRGFGVEMGVVGDSEPFLVSVGGFYALGKPDADKRMRDVYDVRFGAGLKPKLRCAATPFVSVGLDFLYVNTRSAIDGSGQAGPTLGFDARVGVFGVISDRWIYQASASYIGAVVPGTGDGLDGLVFQIGIGKAVFD